MLLINVLDHLKHKILYHDDDMSDPLKEKTATKSRGWLYRTSSHSAKCHPTPIVLPVCCQKRLQVHRVKDPTAPSIEYKINNRAALRKHTMIVGSHHVPFYPIDNAYHRLYREDVAVLDPIDEDDFLLCEKCLHHKLSLIPPCVSISVF
ncbi:unnamed protein product [Aphanomyces euteiches]|uniref:Uncharacterized protein n=1 Tax=Aphanomyces euteiches TaxID=100861 RepID=A0A6G0WAK8_9STRA|nr:hypothetical protein Ae201684_016942 [Aphanomyces euteiches]KAH9073849.1 hypothetical protein Ae201684P_003348 [Aphanomyces euteiches]KAH9101816.1 hypothetical protein AeMF1_021521 [Aphanomyces euteiches]KAH9154488.1 hypothetical protein AeRB84_003425 [Aphanomyces euteiches]KAH9197695.1 hypothetical protein AeNC1_000339 [Aphanomyces euteiches]